jgi:hypothetical protein
MLTQIHEQRPRVRSHNFCFIARQGEMRVLLLFLVSLFHLASAELYTALVDMEELVQSELELMRFMKTYIDLEETRIERLKR